MSDLYDDDILIWSERQAALLRRVAAGERVNEADLDWPNIIEEVESVGRSELRGVESLLFQAILHRLKALAWPHSLAVPGWEGEARGFQAQAQRRFVASMRHRLDIAALYALARQAMPETIDGYPPDPVPPTCPFSLDGLLDPTL